MAWRSKPESGGAATRDAIENVLGRSCVIRGDLSADGAFRIDGTVEGAVESRAAVVVGEGGVVRGGARGTDAVVAGTVIGDEGDISAQSMRIETGGVFRGTSRMGAETPAGEAETADERGALSSVA